MAKPVQISQEDAGIICTILRWQDEFRLPDSRTKQLHDRVAAAITVAREAEDSDD